MQADVIIPIEHKPSEISTPSVRTSVATPSEHADIQVKVKRKGRRWLLLPLILTLCLVTIIALKIDCRRKSGGIVQNCNYNCQPCSDSSGDPCPDICKETHYSEYCSSICETYESYWFVPVLIGFIILYLLECFFCYEWALDDKRDLNSFREYMTKVKSTPPSITAHYESYHYRGTGKYYTITVTVGRAYNGRGYGGRDQMQQTQTRRVEYKEKVVTSTGSESFPISSWEDNTEDISQMEDDWQRIFFCKAIKFKDEETRKSFKRWKREVKSRHNRDTDFSMKTKFDIPGYIDRSLVSKETDARAPYCINGVVFWVLSFLLLTWPYRVYLEIVARLRKVKVIKVIKST